MSSASEESPTSSRTAPITNGGNNSILMETIANGSWDLAIDILHQFPSRGASKWEVVTVRGCRVRLLPVHYACTRNPPISVIQALIDAAPDALSYIDQNGRTLLHWAVDSGNTSPEIIKTILRLHPDSAKRRGDKYGCLPLHVACYSKRQKRLTEYEQVAIVQILLDAYPEGVCCRDRHRGWLPLHIATKTGAPSKVIDVLLEACPSTAAVGDKNHRLPIHYANMRDEDAQNIFESLLGAFPAGLKRREKKSGFTPLAIACSLPSPSANVISALLRHCPSAVSIPDYNLEFPLHLATNAGADRAVIDELLRANPTGAQECDKDGMLPLHWACMNSNSDVVETLLKAFPKGASKTERNNDFLPLHLAVKHGADEDVILSLLSCYPKGARTKGASGVLPLHLACENSANVSLESLEALILDYPEGLNEKDSQGRTPSDYARMSDDEETSSLFLDVLTTSILCSINEEDVDEIDADAGEIDASAESPCIPLQSPSIPLQTLSEENSPPGTHKHTLHHHYNIPLNNSATARYSTAGKRFRSRFHGLSSRLHGPAAASTFHIPRSAAAYAQDDISVSTDASYFIAHDAGGDVKILRGC